MHWCEQLQEISIDLLICRAECPRKKIGEFNNENEAAGSVQAPGLVPSETWISCTYMYNGKSG